MNLDKATVGHLARIRRLDLNLLLTFDVLMRTRSATETARLLHKTQPGISRDLGKLRHALGDELLIPVKGRFQATARAEELHASVHEVLLRLDGAIHQERFDPAEMDEVFNIGIGGYLELLLAGPLLKKIGREAPRCKIRFVPLHGDFATEDLDDRVLDVAIGTFPKTESRFEFQPLFDDIRVAVVRDTHPMARRGSLSKSDLHSMQLFAYSQMYGKKTNFDRALTRKSSFEFSAFLSGFGSAPFVLLDTDMATTMPEFAATILRKHFPLASLGLPKEIAKISYAMAWSKLQHTSASHAWLRNRISEIVMQELSQAVEVSHW